MIDSTSASHYYPIVARGASAILWGMDHGLTDRQAWQKFATREPDGVEAYRSQAFLVAARSVRLCSALNALGRECKSPRRSKKGG